MAQTEAESSSLGRKLSNVFQETALKIFLLSFGGKGKAYHLEAFRQSIVERWLHASLRSRQKHSTAWVEWTSPSLGERQVFFKARNWQEFLASQDSCVRQDQSSFFNFNEFIFRVELI